MPKLYFDHSASYTPHVLLVCAIAAIIVFGAIYIINKLDRQWRKAHDVKQ